MATNLSGHGVGLSESPATIRAWKPVRRLTHGIFRAQISRGQNLLTRIHIVLACRTAHLTGERNHYKLSCHQEPSRSRIENRLGLQIVAPLNLSIRYTTTLFALKDSNLTGTCNVSLNESVSLAMKPANRFSPYDPALEGVRKSLRVLICVGFITSFNVVRQVCS
jgi:hypothetical protein